MPPIEPSLSPSTGPPDPDLTLLDLKKIEDAKRVQQKSIELGFLFSTADGNWGPLSKRALREFRKVQGIGNDDAWNLDTQRQLFSPTAAHPARMDTATYLGGWGGSLELGAMSTNAWCASNDYHSSTS
jgi:peptidoglycan hydrolase-like protein with peptidoglycan-binding domain